MNKQVIFIILALIVGFVGGMVFTTPAFRRGDYMMNMDNVKNSHDMKNMSAPMTSKQMMDNMNLKLEGKIGNEFDEAFLEQMVPHHLGAVQMAQLALTSSKRPEIIKMANEIIISQQKEIETMRTWQKTWFGVKAQ